MNAIVSWCLNNHEVMAEVMITMLILIATMLYIHYR